MARVPALTENQFRDLVTAYALRWQVSLVVVDTDGNVLHRHLAGDPPCGKECTQARVTVLNEAWRWGDPAVSACPHGRLQWAAPIMANQLVTGGIVASIEEARAFSATANGAAIDVRTACVDLRQALERANLTNASALAMRRQECQNEQQRAYAIHAYKRRRHDSVRELYLHEEPALLAAIRSGDVEEAHAVLNRITVTIRHYSNEKLDSIKGYFMELAVTMCRAAADAGGAPEELLGATYTNTTGLAKVSSLADLDVWLRCMLDNILGAVERRRANEPVPVLVRALAFLEQHYADELTRDQVAKLVGVSPSHFSYLIRKETGATFTDLLNRIRIDHAARRLVETRQSLGEIALTTGFDDQSYFTKVFKRYRKRTPLRYRQEFHATART